MEKLQYSTKQIEKNKNQLSELNKTLKEEFFGIDNIIDKITDLIEPWLLIPDAQRKPSIVNLWGMTGTGKTSLVRRVAEILNQKFIQFNLKDHLDKKGSNYSFLSQFGNLTNQPVIILLDEIQNCRTIDEVDNELQIPIELTEYDINIKCIKSKRFDNYGSW